MFHKERKRAMNYIANKLCEYSENSNYTHTSFLYCFGVIILCLLAYGIIGSISTAYLYTRTIIIFVLALIIFTMHQLEYVRTYIWSKLYIAVIMLKFLICKNNRRTAEWEEYTRMEKAENKLYVKPVVTINSK